MISGIIDVLSALTPIPSAAMPNTFRADAIASLQACGVRYSAAAGCMCTTAFFGVPSLAAAVPHATSTRTSPVTISSLNRISCPPFRGSGQQGDDSRRLVRLPCRVPGRCGRVRMAEKFLGEPQVVRHPVDLRPVVVTELMERLRDPVVVQEPVRAGAHLRGGHRPAVPSEEQVS